MGTTSSIISILLKRHALIVSNDRQRYMSPLLSTINCKLITTLNIIMHINIKLDDNLLPALKTGKLSVIYTSSITNENYYSNEAIKVSLYVTLDKLGKTHIIAQFRITTIHYNEVYL